MAVATGVRPQMAAEAVAHVAEAELKKMTARRHADLSQYDIVKLNGVRYADVGAITGTAYTPDPSEADDVTWVVRVKGPLISWISLPGGRDNVANSGYLLINDKLAEIVGMDLD